MKRKRDRAREREDFGIPAGTLSSAGYRYRAKIGDLYDYAGEVFEYVPLAKLVDDADRWLESPRTLTIWAMPVLLMTLTPLQAVLVGLGIYLVWKSFSPAMVSLALAKVFRLFGHVYLQGIYYVFMMSLLAATGQRTAMWTGLAGFIVLRWGVLERLVAPVTGRLHRALFALPVPDQVLRAFIHRAALKHRVSLPELERMEQRIRQMWTRKHGEGG